MKRVAIVQARMTSTRLPGKILMDLAGAPMLSRQLDRMRDCRQLDEIVIATTVNSTDDPVVELAEREGWPHFRGDEDNVLSRYRGAAREHDATLIVRITADCPLIDAEVIDTVIARACAAQSPCDYASNTVRRTFPRGLDVEVFHRDTLERVARLATSAAAREHVTYFIHSERPDLFSIAEVCDREDNSDLRWTVDTVADLRLVQRIYELGGLVEDRLAYREILALVRADPELSAINAHVEQKHP